MCRYSEMALEDKNLNSQEEAAFIINAVLVIAFFKKSPLSINVKCIYLKKSISDKLTAWSILEFT